jgi:2,5-furandicarboxylate decarboxylase 1
VVLTSGVDLGRLPVPTHAPLDGGPFINAGVVIARDPETGRHNLSFNRMQVFGPDLAGVNINLWRHLMEFLRPAEESGRNLPICVAIGVDPVLLMAAATRYPGDEYEVAGGLRREPIPVAPAVTCDLLVPAHAEIVLEGEILAGERRDEGPMAEFTGHYSGITRQAVARIRAITHRSQPIFETIAGASPEHLILGNALTREPALDTLVRAMSPRVAAVHLPPYASGFTAIISMTAPRPGEARSVAIVTLGSHVNVKTVIVVDDDVDIFDPVDVLWALSTRVRWDRDCVVLPGAQGNDLDPSSDERGVQAKMIIDATIGEDRPRTFQKVRYPPVDLREYVAE